MSDGELDFKTMFENMTSRLKDRMNMEAEYFALLKKSEENAKYSDIASRHMFDIKMEDQLMLIKAAIVCGECAKLICEKYGWNEEAEEVETE